MSDNTKTVVSPISGVYYSRPAPEQPAFVETGQAVKKGQTLCLLETMKVFTKIKAPLDGVVAEILIEDEMTVEKNQVILKIQP